MKLFKIDKGLKQTIWAPISGIVILICLIAFGLLRILDWALLKGWLKRWL